MGNVKYHFVEKVKEELTVTFKFNIGDKVQTINSSEIGIVMEVNFNGTEKNYWINFASNKQDKWINEKLLEKFSV